MNWLTKFVSFKKMIYIGGGLLIASAFSTFYFLFFKLAPYVASTIPPSSWQHFLQIVIYGIIAYIGGLALPLLLLILGIMVIIIGTR